MRVEGDGVLFYFHLDVGFFLGAVDERYTVDCVFKKFFVNGDFGCENARDNLFVIDVILADKSSDDLGVEKIDHDIVFLNVNGDGFFAVVDKTRKFVHTLCGNDDFVDDAVVFDLCLCKRKSVSVGCDRFDFFIFDVEADAAKGRSCFVNGYVENDLRNDVFEFFFENDERVLNCPFRQVRLAPLRFSLHSLQKVCRGRRFHPR